VMSSRDTESSVAATQEMVTCAGQTQPPFTQSAVGYCQIGAVAVDHDGHGVRRGRTDP
jgi:hypothetical protein